MTDTLGGGSLAGPAVVSTRQDVLDLLPKEYLRNDAAPVRNALADSLLALNTTYQDRASIAAGLNDILYAVGDYLRSLGEDRGIYQQPDEPEEAYRQRLLSVPDLVTPEAIIAVVNAILAPFTDVEAQYLESINDRAYIRDPAIVSDRATIIGGSPWYPERLYPEDVDANDGFARANSSPGGAWLFRNHIGRYFVLRIPDLGGIDGTPAVIYPPDEDPNTLLARETYGMTASDSVTPGSGTYQGTSFLYSDLQTATAIYSAIISAVDALRGHSIRWMLFVDPTLTA